MEPTGMLLASTSTVTAPPELNVASGIRKLPVGVADTACPATEVTRTCGNPEGGRKIAFVARRTIRKTSTFRKNFSPQSGL